MADYNDVLRNLDGEDNLNKSEQDAFNELEKLEKDVNSGPNSLGRVERIDYAADKHEEIKLSHGYFDLDVSSFPSGGLYYPNGTKVKIKAASVKEIRTFSALDEENPIEVTEAINELMTSCVRVSFDKRVGSWKDILEEDKLFVILSIRELSFPDENSTISFNVKCESCSADNKMEIKNQNFQKRDVDEVLMRYYDSVEKCFNIETKSFGKIKIKPPTAGIMKHVSNYIQTLKERRVNIKEYIPFLKILPYLIDDWRTITEKDIDNLRVEFIGWGNKKFGVYTELCEKAQVSVKDKMRKPCEKCGDPIETEIQLPNGIKGLFIENDILGSELI